MSQKRPHQLTNGVVVELGSDQERDLHHGSTAIDTLARQVAEALAPSQREALQGAPCDEVVRLPCGELAYGEMVLWFVGDDGGITSVEEQEEGDEEKTVTHFASNVVMWTCESILVFFVCRCVTVLFFVYADLCGFMASCLCGFVFQEVIQQKSNIKSLFYKFYFRKVVN